MSVETELVVIALCGKARAGKDTVAQALASQEGFFRMALADGLKSALNDLDGNTWEFRKERDEAGKSDRWAAQQIGTECREAVGYPGHWVAHLMIKMHYAYKVHPVPRHRFVIPDLRCPQEAARLRAFVESLGGRFEIWRINRPGQGEIAESGHSSENHIDSINADVIITNNGTREQLCESAKGASRISLIHNAAKPAAEPKSSLGGKPRSGCRECNGLEFQCDTPLYCNMMAEVDRISKIAAAGPAPPGGQCAADCGDCVDTAWGRIRLSDPECCSEPTPAPSHHIPTIEDALRGLGPFPVLCLSGPMSGIADYNFPAFNKAAEKLRRLGFPVLNPADFGADASLSWEECLQRDLIILGFADVIVQLPGWDYSRGASLECDVAVRLGKGVTALSTLIRSEP